jgi:hypothetical protein
MADDEGQAQSSLSGVRRTCAMTADDWIAHLHLTPHPEGGYFRRSYTAELILTLLEPRRAAPGGDCDLLSAQGRPAFPPAPAESR